MARLQVPTSLGTNVEPGFAPLPARDIRQMDLVDELSEVVGRWLIGERERQDDGAVVTPRPSRQ